jgi:hypothetical protein
MKRYAGRSTSHPFSVIHSWAPCISAAFQLIHAKCIVIPMDTTNDISALVVFACVGLLAVLVLLQSAFVWHFSVCDPIPSRSTYGRPWLSFTIHSCCSSGIIIISVLWHQQPESSRLLQALLVLSLLNDEIGQVCRTTSNKIELV